MTAEPTQEEALRLLQDHVRGLKNHGVLSARGDLKEAKEGKDERARSPTLMQFPKINRYRDPKPREFAEDPEIQPNHLD